MNKALIDLQRGSSASSAIILNDDTRKLGNALLVKADVSDKFLFGDALPGFAKRLEEKSKGKDLVYLVITGIDEIDNDKQDRYIGLVKDREMNGYNLPKNCIVVFSVTSSQSLSKISTDLYHFSVVAI